MRKGRLADFIMCEEDAISVICNSTFPAPKRTCFPDAVGLGTVSGHLFVTSRIGIVFPVGTNILLPPKFYNVGNLFRR